MKNPSIPIYVVCVTVMCLGFIGCKSAEVQPLNEMAVQDINRTGISPSTPSAQEIMPASTTNDCQGDTQPPILSTGWRLQWQRVFEQPIARPPEINDRQLVILEREDPFRIDFKDTIFVLDPQTSVTQWSFKSIDNPAPYTLRQVTDIQWSQKYVAFNVLYADTTSTSPSTAYTIVLDRFTGQSVYRGALNASETMISDEALYYRGTAFRELHRIDLPNRQPRWEAKLAGGNGVRGLFLIDSHLYAFNNDENVYQYDALNGSLVATETLNAAPNPHDVFVQNQIAVVRSSYEYERVSLFDFAAFKSKWTTAVSYPIKHQSNAFFHDLPSMTVSPDSVYLFDANNNLLRIDLSTGKIIWTVPSPTPETEAMSRPVIVGGLVYGLFSDGTIRAFSELEGSQVGVVMQVPLWYWKTTDKKEWRDLVGGLGAAGDTLIITTGCRSVYAIQRAK